MDRINTTAFFIFILASIFCFLSHSYAADISIHGFSQGNYSFSTSENPNGKDFKWSEERFQLKFDASRDTFRLFIKTDGSFEHIEDKGDAELREGYVDYTANKSDLRLGRQIITWGLGDLLFINDIFPKDYEAFFSGRPMEYLKIGADSAKLGMYPNFASLELVVIPNFKPNNYPSSKRFWMYDPMPGITNRETKEPDTKLNNTEIAVRAYRDIKGFDASIYFYRGFMRQPSMLPDNMMTPSKLTLFYPELSVYGTSFQGRAFEGILSLETGYYDSRQDNVGKDPMIPNSQTKFLIGYQKQLWEDLTIGLQYYGEYMHDYSEYEKNLPQGFPKENKLHDFSTIRITRLLKNQTLKLSLFCFYSISDKDYMINPEIKYNFTDQVWGAIGENIFGGYRKWSQFGQLDKNDNVYLQLRYEF